MKPKRNCELPFCTGVVEGTRNKRRCDNDRNIHLHRVISQNVNKIMRFIESRDTFTANDVNSALFNSKLDKNEKGSMYRLFQAMIREQYVVENGKKDGLKEYKCVGNSRAKLKPRRSQAEQHEAINESLVVEDTLTPQEKLVAKLREFVYTQNGQWNHNDWLTLIGRDDVKSLGIADDEIGRVLENEKTKFWLSKAG